MLEILERFHLLGYIHNDLKPQNIMTKINNPNQVSGMGGGASPRQNGIQLFLIDFGLSTSTLDTKRYKFRGTPYFASNGALQR
jgi:serine/threonine protein kinase